MRFLTEKQYRAFHEGHALEVQNLKSDLNVARSERDYYMEARARANDLRITAVNERDSARVERENLRLIAVNMCDEKITVLKERDEARKDEKFWEDRFDVCAGQLRGAEIECAKTRESHDYMTSRYQLACKQIKHVEIERNEAREEADRHKELVEANQNIAAERYMEIKALKGKLAAAEQEIKIVRNSLNDARELADYWLSKHAEVVQALPIPSVVPFNAAEFADKIMPKFAGHGCQPACSACNAAQADAVKTRKPYALEPCACRPDVPECCDICQGTAGKDSAKQADAALDSFDEPENRHWHPSDCIAGTPGCFCDSEVA